MTLRSGWTAAGLQYQIRSASFMDIQHSGLDIRAPEQIEKRRHPCRVGKRDFDASVPGLPTVKSTSMRGGVAGKQFKLLGVGYVDRRTIHIL